MSGQMEMLDDAGAEQEAGTMAALSLWQPWASLIAAGAKRVETRSWETRHRGPVAICSTKTSPPIARSFFENDPHIETVPEIARRIPVSGRQKLWTLPADVERQVCEDVAGRPIG